MNEIHVDVVRAEPLEAPLHRRENVPAGEPRLDQRRAHAVADLGRDHDFLALRPDRFAEHSLGLAARVHVRRVEEVDAAVDRARYEIVRACLIDFVHRREGSGARSESHAAEGEPRNDEPGVTETDVLHPEMMSRTSTA